MSDFNFQKISLRLDTPTRDAKTAKKGKTMMNFWTPENSPEHKKSWIGSEIYSLMSILSLYYTLNQAMSVILYKF